jgi:hypothetical protein
MDWGTRAISLIKIATILAIALNMELDVGYEPTTFREVWQTLETNLYDKEPNKRKENEEMKEENLDKKG